MSALCSKHPPAGGLRRRKHVPEFLWEELANQASEMRKGQLSPPVLLNEICAQLGIKISRRRSVKTGKAYLEVESRIAGAPTSPAACRGYFALGSILRGA